MDVKSLRSFQSMFLSGDFPRRCSTVLSSSSLLLFLLRWIQFKLSVLIIFLSLCQMLSHAGAPLNLSLLAIHLFWSAEDISEDLCFHSQSVQDISRLLSHSSHLIQPVQFTFQAVFSYCYVNTNPFDHRGRHINSFLPVCFSSSGSDHFQHPQDQL